VQRRYQSLYTAAVLFYVLSMLPASDDMKSQPERSDDLDL